LSEFGLADEIGCFGNNKIVAMGKSFAKRFDAGFWRQLTERVERGELFFELALAGHGESVTR